MLNNQGLLQRYRIWLNSVRGLRLQRQDIAALLVLLRLIVQLIVLTYINSTPIQVALIM